MVERVLGKDEVTGSIPVPGSRSAVGTSGGNSVVESLPSKQMVAGSSPVPRSRRLGKALFGTWLLDGSDFDGSS